MVHLFLFFSLFSDYTTPSLIPWYDSCKIIYQWKLIPFFIGLERDRTYPHIIVGTMFGKYYNQITYVVECEYVILTVYVNHAYGHIIHVPITVVHIVIIHGKCEWKWLIKHQCYAINWCSNQAFSHQFQSLVSWATQLGLTWNFGSMYLRPRASNSKDMDGILLMKINQWMHANKDM